MSLAYKTTRVRPGVIKIEIPKITVSKRIKDHVDAIITAFKEFVKPSRITIQFPREKRAYPDNFRGWIKFDITKCISCFQCSFVCPANAIKMKMAPNGKYYPSIDYSKCIFCHFCVDTCTRGALQATKIDEVVTINVDELMFYTENMIEEMEITKEYEKLVTYEITEGEVKIEKVS